jgi:hypothetical protein
LGYIVKNIFSIYYACITNLYKYFKLTKQSQRNITAQLNLYL